MAENGRTKAKSAPQERIAKKVEGAKGTVEATQAAEQAKLPSLHWDTIWSSSVFTLALTAAIFLVGWAYEANWYGFFGINMSQINTPIQQIFIYGFPVLFQVFVIFFLSILLAFVVKVSRRHNSLALTETNWLWIFGFLNILILLMIHTLVYSAFGQTPFFNAEFSKTLPKEISGAATGGITFMIVSVMMAYLLWLNGLEQIPDKPFWIGRTLLVLGMKDIRKYHFENISKRGWLILMIVTFYVEVLGLSASIAMSNASLGEKSVGGYVQKVYLVSPPQTKALDALKVACDKHNCVYGPFGLVVENDSSFYMITWNEKNIPFHPGLFIFPRSSQNEPFVLLPASAVEVNGGLTPAPVGTQTPTLQVTITPIPTSTLEN